MTKLFVALILSHGESDTGYSLTLTPTLWLTHSSRAAQLGQRKRIWYVCIAYIHVITVCTTN